VYNWDVAQRRKEKINEGDDELIEREKAIEPDG
jgi:hypothetical protein